MPVIRATFSKYSFKFMFQYFTYHSLKVYFCIPILEHLKLWMGQQNYSEYHSFLKIFIILNLIFSGLKFILEATTKIKSLSECDLPVAKTKFSNLSFFIASQASHMIFCITPVFTISV